MCGIAGSLKRETSGPHASKLLDGMLQSILHRGPDQEGRLLDGPLAMGMRRLSIIDIADGSQPMFDESGRYAVVFNGEIYNYKELRQQLLARGHRLTTHSDTETIVHLFEDYGSGCLQHLRGMFGLAVWDKSQQELFIARDRLGIKPLYYVQLRDQFLFASEIKALLAHPEVPRGVDLTALSHYLSLKYVPAPNTLFSGIKSLLPGHWMRVKNGRIIETQQYWDLSFEKAEPKLATAESEALWVDRLDKLLRETIAIHLRSDVPFGAFLSGGLDSSTIVALMAQQLSSSVKTFSVGFDGPGVQDELPYAQQVADAFGCEHHTLKIGCQDFLTLADAVLFHLDQPIADQATIATHMVAKLARQHVKMVLTGEGGDELFAGYARYAGERYSPYMSWLPPAAGQAIRAVGERLPGLRRAKIAIGALTIGNEARRFANWFPMFNDDSKRQLLHDNHHNLRAGCESIYADCLSRCDATDPVDRMLYVDTKMWLVDYLLLRGDKLTMANSLEARVPLLDHRVVELAASMPAELKLRGSQRKYILKQLAKKLLPAQILNRKKQGFPIPIESWLRREAAPMMQDLLSSETIHRRGYFDAEFVARLIRQHVSGYADNSTQLWGLISFEMWMRRFIDNRPEAISATPEINCSQSDRLAVSNKALQRVAR